MICPSCHCEISKNATSCPHCGEPFRHVSDGSMNLNDPVHIVGCFIVALMIIAIIIVAYQTLGAR